MVIPPRRWFRFSLRTMFVMVTLLAVWTAYYANWIRQRNAERLLPAPYADGASVMFDSLRSSIPWPLAVLGDSSEPTLYIHADLGSVDGKRRVKLLRRLFPESQITVRLIGRREVPLSDSAMRL